MVQNEINENEEFKRCIYCTEHSKRGCKATHCLYILERMQLGEIKYIDILKDCFRKNTNFHFKKRLNVLGKAFSGEFFLSPYHKDRFFHIKGSILMRNKNRYLASVYLLASDEELWSRAKNHIYRKEIYFSDINIKGISVNTYALFKEAKSIYNQHKTMELNELADIDLISETTFKTIINAHLITVYSDKILKVMQ